MQLLAARPTSTMPVATPVIPTTTSTMPVATPVIPTATSTMPIARPALPSATSTMPVATPVIPTATSTMPVATPVSPQVPVTDARDSLMPVEPFDENTVVQAFESLNEGAIEAGGISEIATPVVRLEASSTRRQQISLHDREDGSSTEHLAEIERTQAQAALTRHAAAKCNHRLPKHPSESSGSAGSDGGARLSRADQQQGKEVESAEQVWSGEIGGWIGTAAGDSLWAGLMETAVGFLVAGAGAASGGLSLVGPMICQHLARRACSWAMRKAEGVSHAAGLHERHEDGRVSKLFRYLASAGGQEIQEKLAAVGHIDIDAVW
eukprot:5498358-Prymnesium_polylepis.1